MHILNFRIPDVNKVKRLEFCKYVAKEENK